MFEFVNPGFLAAGGMLVSSPIIIHLINRLRYKRVRWAAMEFLLKSQKKNRRRLIIEQLILLFLRCLLVVLATLLVARVLKLFNFQLGSTAQKRAVHVVLLDDSLSMNDWVPQTAYKSPRTTPTCFAVAKDVIANEIVEKARQSSTPQDLVLIPLSQLAVRKGRFKPTFFANLADEDVRKKLQKELDSLKCSSLHLTLPAALRRARAIADDHKEDQVHVHVLSDFRHQDWATGDTKPLSAGVVELAREAKVNLIDCAHPFRKKEKDTPPRHDNVGIGEFKPESRVVASGTYVRFALVLDKHSPGKKKVTVNFFNTENGQQLGKIDKELTNRQTTAWFETTLDRASDGYYQVTAQLVLAGGKGEEADGLAADNVRHTAVYVRAQIPLLIVDGDPRRGAEDGGDTRHVATALESAPGGGFKIDRGGAELLTQPNLARYPTIFLLNVPSLTVDQERALDTYVANGGSAAFFLGKDVNPQYYNKDLYKNGKGLFPVELADQYTPPRDKRELQPDLDDGRYKVLIRADKFPNRALMPIFGAFFEISSSDENNAMLDTFRVLAVRRYWELHDLSNWKPKPGEVEELATMPNLNRASVYGTAAQKIREKLAALLDEPSLRNYGAALNYHSKQINRALERDKRGREKDCSELAGALGDLLNDVGETDRTTGKPFQGKAEERANLKELLERKPYRGLRDEIADLWKTVQYGHPLVLASRYKQGRVVTVMTSAGAEWNTWPALPSYVPFILEMQSYLTSLGNEANLTVGTTLPLDLGKAYDRKVKRTYFLSYYEKTVNRRPRAGKADTEEARREAAESRNAEPVTGEDYAREEPPGSGNLVYHVDNTLRPGFYLFTLTPRASKDEKARAQTEERGYAFNVDTANEGDLRRVPGEVLADNLRGAPKDSVAVRGPYDWAQVLVDRQTDFSETPWFYLLFLMVLVAEQAMAVHLSFHLRDTDTALPVQAIRSQSRVAAA